MCARPWCPNSTRGPTLPLPRQAAHGSPVGMGRFIVILLAISACTELPQLNLPSGIPVADAELRPIEPLLVAADRLRGDPDRGIALAGSLQARAAALSARAARLRGPVIPPQTRARMRAGVRASLP